MKLKMVLLCMTITVAKSLSVEKKMILDVIQSYEKGPVLAKLCWRISDKLDLAIRVMNIDRSRSIQLIQNFYQIKRFLGEDMIIVVDLNCNDVPTLLEDTDENIFEEPFKWLMISKDHVDSAVPKELEHLRMLVNSHIVVTNRSANDDFTLHLVYKIDETSGFIIEHFGFWSKRSGLSKHEAMNTATAIRRRDLQGKKITMTVAITHESTKTEIYSLSNHTHIMKDVYAKGSYHNINPLYDFMNATQGLIYTSTWGYQVNGSWTGMVGHLQRKEADLSGTMLLMVEERLELMNYLSTSFNLMARFVFLAPPLSLQNNLFVLPFRGTVWACISVLIVILIIIIYINARWERTLGLVNSNDPLAIRPVFSDVAMCVAGAITQQGCEGQLKGSLGRAVTFVTLLAFLFLYTSYSASIIALLQSTSDQIHTLTDLLNSKLELGVEDLPYTRHYFMKATDPVRKAIYENKVARTGYKPNFMKIHEGIKKMRSSDPPFAFHMTLCIGYGIVNQYFEEHEKCNLREVHFLPQGKTWYCSRKGSPYNEIFKLGMIRISEHGVTERVFNQVCTRKPVCEASGSSVASVNMVDFRPVLLYWLYGVLVAFFALSVEIFIHRRQKRIEMRMRESFAE